MTEIRTAGTAEQPLFCLSDICKVLDLQTNKVKARLNERCVNSIPTPTPIRLWVGVQTGVKKDGTPAMQTVEMQRGSLKLTPLPQEVLKQCTSSTSRTSTMSSCEASSHKPSRSKTGYVKKCLVGESQPIHIWIGR